jgi:3-hydroxyacyl-CoA dehydrogenase
VMIERDQDSLDRGRANVEKVYNSNIAKGRMTEAQKAAVMARLPARWITGFWLMSIW